MDIIKDLEEQINKIVSVTGKTYNEVLDEIRREIDKFTGLIDEEGAIVLLFKKYNISYNNVNDPDSIEYITPINKIVKKDRNINLMGLLKSLYPIKTFGKKTGETGRLRKGIIQDKTGSISFILWDENVDRIKDNDINKPISIVNASSNLSQNGKYEISVGSLSRIIQDDLIKYDFLPSNNTMNFQKISDISLNNQFASISGTIISIDSCKSYNKKTGEIGSRQSIKFKDESQSITIIVFWDKDTEILKNLNIGDNIQFTDLRVKSQYKNKELIEFMYSTTSTYKIINKNNSQLISIKQLYDNKTKGFLGNIECYVLEIIEFKSISTKTGETKYLLRLSVKDYSAQSVLTLWNDLAIEYQNVELNSKFTITNVYLKRDVIFNTAEIALSRSSEITLL